MYYLRSAYLGRVGLAVALDGACFAAASGLTWLTLRPEIPGDLYAAATVTGMLLTVVALFYCDAYRPAVIGDGRRTLVAIFRSMGLAFVGAIVFYFGVSVPKDVVPSLAHVALLCIPLLIAERFLYRMACKLPGFESRVLVIGASDLGFEIADALRSAPNTGIELVGFLSDESAFQHGGATFARYPVLGKTHELEKVLEATRIDNIVVASKNRDEFFPQDALQAAKMRGCRAESGVSFFERISGKIYLRDLRPSYLIFSEGFRMGPLSSAAKRGIDIVGSALALLLVSPVIALCAIAIKLESPGSVFFKQIRNGRGDKPFMMYKLRSMCEGAEAETGAVFTAFGDDRITRVGQFIRQTRLDEVPQLWNIFRGDMSLVGPRAERPEFVEALSERYSYYRVRSSVKPGLTGWAQTRFGYVNDVDAYEEKLALDLYYLKYRSLTMDVLILWQTIKTVLLFRGM
jgi:exopolysaccharide biosynthesis polyprenyl glycosylphosphotransferase